MHEIKHDWASCREALTQLIREAGDGIRLSNHFDGADDQAVFCHAFTIGLRQRSFAEITRRSVRRSVAKITTLTQIAASGGGEALEKAARAKRVLASQH